MDISEKVKGKLDIYSRIWIYMLSVMGWNFAPSLYVQVGTSLMCETEAVTDISEKVIDELDIYTRNRI